MSDRIGKFTKEVGHRIALCRKKSEWTQEQLAKAMGVSRTSVSNKEAGRQAITVEDCAKVAKSLGVAITVEFRQREAK